MLKLRLLLFFLGCCALSWAQNNPLFSIYTANEGLPQTNVTGMMQDKNGFLWIGTDGGLCRFDGYNFKNYKRSTTDKTAFNSEKGINFYLDHAKRLWIISYNGISLYNDEKDNFNNLLTIEPINAIITHNNFLGEDEQFIWAGLGDYGLLTIDKKTLKVTKINIPGIHYDNDHTTWFKGFYEKGKLWVSHKNTSFIYNTRTKEVKHLNIPLVELTSVNAYVAAGIANNKAILINKKDLSTYTINVSAKNPTAKATYIYSPTPTRVVISVEGIGMVRFDVYNKAITRTIRSLGSGSEKKALLFTYAYKDWSGNLWVSTLEGLRKLNYHYKKFKLYRSEDPKSNSVYSVTADKENVYIGSVGMGMDIYSKKNGFIKKIAFNQLPFLQNTGFVAQALNQNELFILANSNLQSAQTIPIIYDKKQGTTRLLPQEIQQFYTKHWIKGVFHKFVYKDADNQLLTNVGEYLVSINEKNKVLTIDPVKQFNKEMLACCFRDAAKNLWVGTYKSLYVLSNKVWTKVPLPKAMEIKTINEDLNGNIWLGHSDGIFVLNNDKKIIATYNESNFLKNEHIYCILRADDGDMWFSHNKGLTRFNWKEKSFRDYTEDDGLQAAEFNFGAAFKAADGELYFGGINGTTAFYPHELKDNPTTPKVRITNIQLFDKPYLSHITPWNVKEIALNHKENELSFEFVLPEFTNPTKNTYAYQMEGIDKSWIYTNNRRFARYPSLNPGHYTFKVKASNNDGVWSKETSIKIVIQPAFWQEAWFLMVFTTLILSSIWFGVTSIQKRNYQRKLRVFELQRKLQLERERISRDLHDNVGTQLSLISKNIENIIHPVHALKQAERERNLISISQTSKEVIATLRETIWALNKEKVSFEEFADKLKGYAHKQVKIYSKLKLNFEEDIHNAKLHLNATEAINLFRICQEAIANAMKYANASNLNVALSVTGKKYTVVITDDGEGFEEQQIDPLQHYGMDNMKYRAAEIGCKVSVESKLDQFTSITISKK